MKLWPSSHDMELIGNATSGKLIIVWMVEKEKIKHLGWDPM